MKTQSTIFAAAALLLACITPSHAADPAVPDFLKEIVIKAAPPLTKEQRAALAVYQLNNSMFNIYDNSLDIYQKNIRARVPLIMALFSGKGGRFILYRPGQEPLEAPSVPSTRRRNPWDIAPWPHMPVSLPTLRIPRRIIPGCR
jgi:hypothetical protein